MVLELVGIGMKPKGAETDAEHNMQPFSDNQLVEYRVWFKRGKTYQIDWWSKYPSLRLKPANSSYSYNRADQGAFGITKYYGPFVMTMDLEMYMTKHSKALGVFHSCYVNQRPVLMAGAMLIEDGNIRGIRCDSGHYQPTSHEFRKFLDHLRALGVRLSDIEMFDFDGTSLGNASRLQASQRTPAPVAVIPKDTGYAA
jgi:hypothetical protein